jgi:hypothetical protein
LNYVFLHNINICVLVTYNKCFYELLVGSVMIDIKFGSENNSSMSATAIEMRLKQFNANPQIRNKQSVKAKKYNKCLFNDALHC